ncbi:glutamate--cysteine ligase [Pseudonocardia kujensis]|uniref:carboxylate-amine ligase n=1 Tax=Pseudonocardia kujensis TaxID=1128675 RepID=UPI001E3D6D5F|nr:glutamate--cysteine ligase [Pseudonocardia kujensis]MCE0763881.1 glutamate--cysteine ligase [Pseudonocardia kujensis]
MAVRTLGVEEEFLLVDPDSGEPRAVGATVLRRARDAELTGELQAEQVETATDAVRDLGDLLGEIRTRRAQAAEAARAAGVEAVPLGTPPVPADAHVSPDDRYRAMVERFGRIGREQLTCACHVHVAVGSDEEAVGALDRIRPWLAVLLALSVNSPFWAGTDTGYAGFRTQVWGRWPSAGPTGPYGSAAAYRELTEALLGTDTLLDQGMLYFDARVSHHQPTLEVRVADVCREPADAVLVAALTRALVETAAREWADGVPADPVRTEILRLAAWRASRSGLDADLLHPHTWRPAPAAEVVRALLEHVGPALRTAGDHDTVTELWQSLVARRPGATHQRRALEKGGDLRAVVHDALAARG